MSITSGQLYGSMILLIGILALLGWLFATAGNARCGAIFRKSFVLLALPMIFTPGRWLLAHVGMWAVVAFEEGVKAFASTREQNLIDRFWLVSMFGIWELIFDKALAALFLHQPVSNGSPLQIIGLLYATALPVLMHIVTAAIYSFAFERWIWAAFLVSWSVHLAFNEAVQYFDLSVSASLAETVVLVVLLVGVFRNRNREIVTYKSD